jgi:hypothetical protein
MLQDGGAADQAVEPGDDRGGVGLDGGLDGLPEPGAILEILMLAALDLVIGGGPRVARTDLIPPEGDRARGCSQGG